LLTFPSFSSSPLWARLVVFVPFFIRPKKARLAAIREEIDGEAAIPLLKREVKSERMPTLIPGEIIDLTLD
jgi:hypothetical protein